MAQWWERSPPTNVAWVRFRPGAICGLFLLLVHALIRGFFSGFSGFPPSRKINISKFQFDQDRVRSWKPTRADVASSQYHNLFIYWLGINSKSYVTKRKRITNIWNLKIESKITISLFNFLCSSNDRSLFSFVFVFLPTPWRCMSDDLRLS